ncbi:MAG: DEAD/DEAH box helicase [Planctomycetota bacterium]|jgi:ATP-dependent Lhr-like helicase|nr:DEAD/DEAH box helicase [Planctomycetota bacterium]
MAVKKEKALKIQKKHRALASFLPPVSRWFAKTFEKPSPAQVKAWPKIRKGDHTLLLAPTGSGKTLAAFLCAIDGLFRQAEEGTLEDGIQVLYISPLKALGNDIHKNLLEPLAGIRKESRGKLPDLKVAVRTGDTSQSERARMIRKPPHILITTPESLYLLLGGKRWRRI